MKTKLALVIVLAAIALFWLGVSRYVTLEEIQRVARSSGELARHNPLLVSLLIALAQCIGMAFSLPTKALLTLLAGALLGAATGSLITLAGVVIGTSGLFFATRHLFRDNVRNKLGHRFDQVEARLGRHPIRALVGLRLFITLPYGPITLASALTGMTYKHFLIGSVIGDVPVIIAYCLAGEQLYRLTSVSEAVSPWTVATLVGVGIFVFLTAVAGKSRKGLEHHRGKRPTDVS